jgi:hypothetical protein
MGYGVSAVLALGAEFYGSHDVNKVDTRSDGLRLSLTWLCLR